MAKRKEEQKLMDARELTKVVNKLSNDMIEVKKEADFLRQELEKIRLISSDLQIEIKQMGGDLQWIKASRGR